jgi:hypothetical protein
MMRVATMLERYDDISWRGQDRIRDPQYWRDRAEETRTMAAKMIDADAKHAMSFVVSAYEHLTEVAEARLRQIKG